MSGFKVFQNRKIRKRNADWLAAYKSSLICELCGSGDDISFHHVRDKKHEVADMAIQTFSIAAIEAEIAKCQVLCHLCHVKHHRTLKRGQHVASN